MAEAELPVAPVDPDDEVAAFARAFNPLCRAWFWCVWLGGAAVQGIPAIAPLAAIVVLFWVVRLQRAAEGTVARYLTGCVATAVGAAAALVAGAIVEPDLMDSPARDIAWTLAGFGLLMFCRAMQPWLAVYDQRHELLARWRRSEKWVWAAIVSFTLAGIWSLAGHSMLGPEYHYGDRSSFAPLGLYWAVVTFGPLLSVGGSAASTKDSLKAYLASLSPRTASTT